jgi:hypothetical protein
MKHHCIQFQHPCWLHRPALQNDSTSTHAKDLDVALSDDRLVLIMDDTEQVGGGCVGECCVTCKGPLPSGGCSMRANLQGQDVTDRRRSSLTDTGLLPLAAVRLSGPHI